MNVTLPEKPKGRKKRTTIYLSIITVCVIAIGIAIYQFFAEEKLEVILGLAKSTDEKIEQLKSEFDNIFTNKLKSSQGTYDLVNTEYERQEKVSNNYDLNVNIPNINIDNNLAKKYNEEIKQIFQNPTQDILQTQSRNIVYTVNYVAYEENGILSLAILSTFKEGNSAQRTIAKTYNYDLNNNKEVSLEDFLKIKNIDKNIAQSKIKREIEKSQEQTEKLRELGYNVFARNTADSMYKIENTKEFFMYDGNLYLIYAYGNNSNTGELDLVII